MNMITRPQRKALRTCARIAKEHGVPLRDMIAPHGTSQVVLAKQCAMYELRKNHGWSYTRIGRFFGLKTHGSALHAVRKIQRLKDKRIMIQPASPDDIQDPFEGAKKLTGVSITIAARRDDNTEHFTTLGTLVAPNTEKLKAAIRFLHANDLEVNLADTRPCQIQIIHKSQEK